MRPPELEATIVATWPRVIETRDKVLLGVSGGADSVAMLRALVRIRSELTSLVVAHFNHQWRGAESDQDQAFVQHLCEVLGVDFRTGEPSAEHDQKISEENARSLRYEFFEQTAYRIGARYVATAHTASDRAETVLHNLFRGTGLAGARSIQVTRPLGSELVLVRPLLRCYREQVVEYLDSLEQNYRSDSTNRDTKFRRSFLRHELLPTIRKVYGPNTDRKLIHFADNALEIDELLRELAEAYLAEVEDLATSRLAPLGRKPNQDAGVLKIPTQQLLPVKWPVLRTAIAVRYGHAGWGLGRLKRSHWQDIRELHSRSDIDGSILNLPGEIRVCCQDGWLLFTPAVPKDAVN